MKKSKLILLRHGQSIWNEQNRFTGWVDIPLSKKGVEEALQAGEEFKEIPIDLIFVSTLIRAKMTAFLSMLCHSSGKVPVLHHEEGKEGLWGKICDQQAKEGVVPTYSAWQLNERMYGTLQGLNKEETALKYGKEQVKLWRRSYDIQPPEGESLKMTAERTLPFFDSEILPKLQEGKNILVSAHGNSLRSIVMKLDQLTPEEVVALEIPTGQPLIYTFLGGNWSREE